MPLFGGPPNIEKMKAKRDIEGLIKALDYKKDQEVRDLAARALEQIGDARAVEPLIAALKDPDRFVRSHAAAALGRIGDVRAVEPLITALKDSDGLMCSAAVRALEQIGDARAVEPLIAVLKNSDSCNTRSDAAAALGTIGDVRAVEPLIVAFKDSEGGVHSYAATALEKIGTLAVEPLIAALVDSTRTVRKTATDVLDKLGWKPDRSEKGAAYWVAKEEWDTCVKIGIPAVEPLIVALKDSEGYMRKAAAVALGTIGDAQAVEPLIAALKDSDKSVRLTAMEALGRIGDARAVELLIASLKDPDVRYAAAEALDKLGWKPDKSETGADYWIALQQWDKCAEIGAPAVEPLIVAFKTPNMHIRKAAAAVLGTIGDTRAVEPLIAALKDSGLVAGLVRCDAIEALGRIGDTRAVEPLIAALQGPDENVRKAAAEVLGRISDARAVEPLIAALKNPNWDVRKVAAETLDKLGWIPGKSETGADYWIALQQWDKCAEIGTPAVEPLSAALKCSFENVRKAAAAALGTIGVPAVEALIAALDDSDRYVHSDAAEVLEKIGAPAVEPLIAALKDSSERVRKTAAEVLGKIGDTRAVETLEKLKQEPSLTSAVPVQPGKVPTAKLELDAEQAALIAAELSVGGTAIEISTDQERLFFVTSQRLSASELPGLQEAVETGHIKMSYHYVRMPAYPIFAIKVTILDNPDNPFWMEVLPNVAQDLAEGGGIFDFLGKTGEYQICFHFYDPNGNLLFRVGYRFAEYSGLVWANDLEDARLYLKSLGNRANFSLGSRQYKERF